MAAEVDQTGAALTVDDPDGRWSSLELWYHLRRPYPDRSFRRVDGQWRYWLRRPAVDRLEYMLAGVRADGSTELAVDPTNQRRVQAVFGEHSVLEFPGYREPWWVSTPDPDGRRTTGLLPHAQGLSRDLPVVVWTPAAANSDDVLPLLLVHDGKEMDRYADVLRYAGAVQAAGTLPPFRVGLLSPLDRDAWYSGSPGYARSLATAAVPALLDQVPTRGRPVLAGASLGGLAALHAEWQHPGTFDGLYLASGSFFQVRLDEQESGHSRFFRVTSAVERVLDARSPWTSALVSMACGRAEENWENNESMLAALTRVGVAASLRPFADGHTWVGWRDSLDPALTAMLEALWA